MPQNHTNTEPLNHVQMGTHGHMHIGTGGTEVATVKTQEAHMAYEYMHIEAEVPNHRVAESHLYRGTAATRRHKPQMPYMHTCKIGAATAHKHNGT